MSFLIPVYIYFFLYLHTCCMHMYFSVYFYTFTRSSDSLNLHIQICGYLLLIRFLARITGILRSQRSSHSIIFSRYFLSLFYSMLSWFYALGSCLFYFLFLCHHLWMFVCDIAVILIYYSDCIASLGYFKFSVYAWGIFLVYIRRRLLSRLRFSVFWEAGRDMYWEDGQRHCWKFWLDKCGRHH